MVGAVVVVVLVAVVAFNWFAILHPHSDAPVKADVVVAIAGVNNPARIAEAKALVQQGYAARLVTDIPSGRHDGSCQQAGVTCFKPSPNTTQGEARYVAALAKENGWHTVMLVLSKDQAFRARIRFRRCYSGTLTVIAVPSANSFIYNVIYQDAALVKAEVWERSC